MIITTGNKAQGKPRPASYYAKIAAAGREMGMDIANDDYEKIDSLLESAATRATMQVFKPAKHYAEIAATCRALGEEVRDTDFEKINTLSERSAVKTTVQGSKGASASESLVNGFLPYEATDTWRLVN